MQNRQSSAIQLDVSNLSESWLDIIVRILCSRRSNPNSNSESLNGNNRPSKLSPGDPYALHGRGL